MLKPLKQIATLIALLFYTLLSFAAVPMTVTLQPGAPTSLPSNGIANVSYLVSLNQAVPGSLNLSVINGLPGGVTQNVSGPSACAGASTICQQKFGLAPGGACCLKLTLNASLMPKTAQISPLVATTPAAYQGQGALLTVKITASESFSVTSSAGTGGVIAPNGPTTVAYGASKIFTATPNAGNTIYQWLVDGTVVQTGGTTYTLTNITANHTVMVTFSSTTTTITVPSTFSIAYTVAGDTSASGSITVTNTGAIAAINVQVTNLNALTCSSAASSDITQTPCNAPAMGTCTITFSTSNSIVCLPQGGISVSGTNTNTATTATAFSIAGYYVFALSNSPASIEPQVIDSSDYNSNIGDVWQTGFSNIGASSLTDGSINTATIYAYNGTTSITPAAAIDCYNSTDGGAAAGTWYLPAICQMGGVSQGASCTNAENTTIDNLFQLGFITLPGTMTYPGIYWSSTEYSAIPQSNAWIEYFASGGSSNQYSSTKAAQLGVRCSRALTP